MIGLLAIEGVAHAAGGAADARGTVALLGLLAAAWLAAHLVVERAQQRLLALTGVEYVLLGVLLGPAVLPGVGLFADASSTRPLFAFVVGWIGFLAGISFDPVAFVRERRAAGAALLDVALRGGGAGALAWWLLERACGDGPTTRMAAATVACAAAAPSAAAVALLESRYGGKGSTILPFIRRWSAPAAGLAIALTGAAFSWFHRGETLAVRPPGPAEWTVFTVGIGVLLAVAFLLFLGRDRSQNHVFLAAAGTLLFASGAAFFLHVSAIAVNFVLGVALARTTVGPGIRDAVDRTAGPARIVLLLFAGTLWRPVDPLPALLLPLAILGARGLGGLVAGAIATVGSDLRGDVVRGTLAQGDVAVAIAVSLRIAYDGPAVDLAFHAILAAVALSELVAPRALRGLLVDAGELDEDLAPEPWTTR